MVEGPTQYPQQETLSLVLFPFWDKRCAMIRCVSDALSWGILVVKPNLGFPRELVLLLHESQVHQARNGVEKRESHREFGRGSRVGAPFTDATGRPLRLTRAVLYVHTVLGSAPRPSDTEQVDGYGFTALMDDRQTGKSTGVRKA